MALTRKAIPESATLELTESLIQQNLVAPEIDVESMTIRDLLVQVQELFNVRDPANDKINLIKDALIARIAPVYNDVQQLQLFDELNGFAFRDPDDSQQIVIQHPDVALQFRLKKVPVTKWKEIMRSVSQEAERRALIVSSTRNLHASQLRQEDLEQLAHDEGYIEALMWVLDQVDVRNSFRLYGRFVAAGHQVTEKNLEE
jgi:hypothetical protein